AIGDCQGLVLCSPEYNYGISGVLKNALDWASRPSMNSPLKGKPALIMTSSPSFAGGVRAQVQIRETLTACLSRPLNRAQAVVNHANDKVKDGKLTDQPSIDFMLAAIDDLVAEIRLVEGAEEAKRPLPRSNVSKGRRVLCWAATSQPACRADPPCANRYSDGQRAVRIRHAPTGTVRN